MIRGGDGFNRIYGGPGNDHITDGDHSSEIHTGPGRNTVISGEGRDVIHVGPGENRVTGGPGGVSYRVQWGGVLTITDWRDGDELVLTGWPAAPEVVLSDGRVVISQALSFIVLEGVSDLAAVRAALRHDGA